MRTLINSKILKNYIFSIWKRKLHRAFVRPKEVTARPDHRTGGEFYFSAGAATLPRIHDAMTIVRDDGRKL